MSIPNQSPGAAALSIPTGTPLASYTSYEDAQRAVDHLSDTDHNVRLVSIVGEDLRLVERITGSLNYAKVAGSGAATGAWFGLMMALVMWLVIGDFGFLDFVIPVVVGAAFGVLLGIVSYAVRPKTRDFTSASTVVAKRYTVIAGPAVADEMRAALQKAGLLGAAAAPARSAAPAQAYATAPAQAGGAGGAATGQPGQEAWTPGRQQAGDPRGAGQAGPAAHAGGPQDAGNYGGAPADPGNYGGAPAGAGNYGGAPAGAGNYGGAPADAGAPTPGIAPAADGTPRYGARLEDLSPEQRAHAEDQLRQADAHRAETGRAAAGPGEETGEQPGQGHDQR
ncbi:MAG: general stress protein [Actinomycetaceae bacterium]